MTMKMLLWLELAVGLLIWCGVLWDGFATIVLPRTVAPMRRVSGRFYEWSWRLWSAMGRRIRDSDLGLSFLAIYGPVSVMVLLVLWAGLLIVAFAMIYHGLGDRFQADRGSIGFGALIYMSGSTFFTLGLGDITSTDSLARFFMILETATGYIFLGLIITYMPLLHQAYGSREIGNLLILTRAGHPPNGIKLLRRYSGSGYSELLRAILRESERWMAETLQSHLSHPVLAFYRAHHRGQSWLVSVTTVMDTSALLIATGDGVLAAQARITYRMGLRLLRDLTNALSISVDRERGFRLTESSVPRLRADLDATGIGLTLSAESANQLLRLVRRYDVRLSALSRILVIPLPPWFPTFEEATTTRLFLTRHSGDT
jgi:hypothetical protein